MYSPNESLADFDLEKYRCVLESQPSEMRALGSWVEHGYYPFQRKWLLDQALFAICNKSRQVGTSYTTGGVGVLWGAFHGELTTVISKGQEESDEVLDKCRRHVAVLQGLGSKLAHTNQSNQSEIVFASGGRIIALPSTGGRSFSGNVFLDEFAYQQHATKVWDNAAPVTLLGDHKLRVVSTPNGIGNEFHQLWELANGISSAPFPENIKGVPWSVHEISIDTAMKDGFPVDINKCWTLAKGDPRIFDQMFNCSFLDSIMQYIATEKIDLCRVKKILLPDDKGLYYAGLDIGREADLSVLTVVLFHRGIAKPVHIETIRRTDSDGLEAMVAWAFKRYRLKRLCIDSTGLGTFPSERMKKKHGDRLDVPHRRNKVEPIDFTLNSKEELATNLYTVITDKSVLLPDDDAFLPAFERWNEDEKGQRIEGPPIVVNQSGTAVALRKELASIRRVVTPSGNVTYDAPRTKDGHADRAWSLMLALYACDKVHPMIAALQQRIQNQNVPQ